MTMKMKHGDDRDLLGGDHEEDPEGKTSEEGAPDVTVDDGKLAWALSDAYEDGLQRLLEPGAETGALDLVRQRGLSAVQLS